MKKGVWGCLFLVLMILVSSGGAFADPTLMGLFNSTYPSSPLVGRCSVCHVTTSPPITLNSYGHAVFSHYPVILPFDNEDSDGDTFSNLAEINAGSFPGNPASVPPTSPGTLQFSASSYSVGENGGSFTITVTRTGGSNGAVGVHYATSNGTATGGSDYTSTSGTLSWANGDTSSKTFTVAILDDFATEGNETVSLALNNPTGGAVLGSINTAVLTIFDGDEHAPATISVASLGSPPAQIDFLGREYYTANREMRGNEGASPVVIATPVFMHGVGQGDTWSTDRLTFLNNGHFVDDGMYIMETQTGNAWKVTLTGDGEPRTVSLYVYIGHIAGAGDYLLSVGSATTTISQPASTARTLYQVDVTFTGAVTVEMKPLQTLSWCYFALAGIAVGQTPATISVTSLGSPPAQIDFLGREYYTANREMRGNEGASPVVIAAPVFMHGVGQGDTWSTDRVTFLNNGHFVDDGMYIMETQTGNAWKVTLTGDGEPRTVSLYVYIGHIAGAGDYLLSVGSATTTISQPASTARTLYQVDVTFTGAVTVEMKPLQTLSWCYFALAGVAVQ